MKDNSLAGRIDDHLREFRDNCRFPLAMRMNYRFPYNKFHSELPPSIYDFCHILSNLPLRRQSENGKRAGQ